VQACRPTTTEAGVWEGREGGKGGRGGETSHVEDNLLLAVDELWQQLVAHGQAIFYTWGQGEWPQGIWDQRMYS